MTHILCIETATEICSVAIAKNGETISLVEDTQGNNHASQLHILVAKALEQSNLHFSDLQAVAVSKGPGSYTGLRVGVSAAKGYCYALKIPLIAINTLQSLANGFWQNNLSYSGLVCPMIDARRMEVYCAVFNSNKEMIREVRAEILTEESFNDYSEKVYFVGDSSEKAKLVLTNPNFIFKDEIVYPSSKWMSELSYRKFLKSEFEDVAYFEPYYLKDFMLVK